jgi:hypothetical protein
LPCRCRVYLNRECSPNPKPSWFGESVGHHENGELVVDPIGFAEHEYSFADIYRAPHTKVGAGSESAYWRAPAAHTRAREAVGAAESDPYATSGSIGAG